MENKLTNYSLVYFGAAWDFKPVRDPLYRRFNDFIFIDALPDMTHYEKGMNGYEKCKDRDSFINTLKKYASKYGLRLVNIKENLLTFKNEQIKVQYYINTTVTDVLNNSIIRKKLNKVIWNHVKGFYPYEYGLKIGDLPNLVDCRAVLKKL